MKQNESVKKLEVGKDYVNMLYNNYIVIDRAGDFGNKGFYDDLYKNQLSCSNTPNWREATEAEVIEAFKKYLVHRYGEDWETMKIKERHPSLSSTIRINDGLWNVNISKDVDSWSVWNVNGVLYGNGIWVERLEEKKSTDWTPAHADIEAMNKRAIEKLPIDKVTTRILGIALRMVGIQLDVNIIDKIIDLVELIENKGDDVTIKDIVSLQQTWSRHS